MQKALAYIRFSSDEQKDGNSIERQTANVKRYAERIGLSLEKVLIDEGKSAYKGTHLSNGELGRFLAEADKGGYRGYAFLVEEQDRLSRQGIMATFAVVGRLLEAGLEIHVTEKNLAIRAFEDLDNLSISVPTIVNGSSANEYSKKLSARVLSARAAEREKARETGLAITARVPTWLKAEIGKKPHLIPERAATVKRIFELAGAGIGCKRIVDSLNAEGRKPFSNGKQGQKWTPEFVQKTLSNRAVLGEHLPHKLVHGKRVPVGEPIQDYFPAVVTSSEWLAARQSVAAKNRNRSKLGGYRGGGRQNVHSVFSPLVFDAENRVTMVFHGKRGDHPYLVSKWQSGKRSHYLRYDKFEGWMLALLADLDWQTIAGESESPEIKAASGQLDAVLGEIDRRKGRLAGLEKLVEEGSFSASLFAALDAEKAALGDLASRSEKLAATLAAARSKAASLHAPEDLLEIIRSGNDPELRLRLKNEIAKRVAKIEVLFGEEGWRYYFLLRFINGAMRGLGVDKAGRTLAAEIKMDARPLR